MVEQALRDEGIAPQITMTDLFPNIAAPGTYWPQPVDAAPCRRN